MNNSLGAFCRGLGSSLNKKTLLFYKRDGGVKFSDYPKFTCNKSQIVLANAFIMTKLFYTVEKQNQTIDTVEECTGWKTIQVYEIANDQPKMWLELEARNDDSSEEEIQTWLDNNGFEDRKYEFVRL